MPLACPSCLDRLTVPEIFEGAIASSPDRSLVTFVCPRCGDPGIARLGDGLAETTRPAEEGGVKVFSFEVAPDLAVVPRRRALRIWFAGRSRDVPERRILPLRPPPTHP